MFSRISSESKESFFKKIKNYYLSRCKNENYNDNIIMLSKVLTDHFYNQYGDFRKLYPKSKKRYSSFDVKDLDNPLTHDLIIDFSKKHVQTNYIGFCSCLFGMSEQEFLVYEKNRSDFENMF